MMTPEQNLDGVMRYLKLIAPQREAFEKATRYGIDSIRARLEQLDAKIAELEARLDELL